MEAEAVKEEKEEVDLKPEPWPNYRITFETYVNYFENFEACFFFIPIINKIFIEAYKLGISQYEIWFFFEPYAEITWLCDDPEISERLLEKTKEILEEAEIEMKSYLTPEDGQFADWFGKTRGELDCNCTLYALSSLMAFTIVKHYKDISSGFGLAHQYARRSHVLANQLGLNYFFEGKIMKDHSNTSLRYWYKQWIPYKARCSKYYLLYYLTHPTHLIKLIGIKLGRGYDSKRGG